MPVEHTTASDPASAKQGGSLPLTLWGIVLLCLAINVAIGAAIATHRPEYLRDYRQSADPDGWDYVQLGRNLLLKGHYSRSHQSPYVTDALRTPGYPVLAGALDIAGGAVAIYAVQALLQAASCLLLFVWARPLLGQPAACWASLLYATDLIMTIQNFAPMSEPLYLFLMLASAALLFPILLEPESQQRFFGRTGLGSALLGLAILVRPAALYLPAILALGCVGVGLVRRRLPRCVLTATIVLAVSFVPPGLWAVRNALVFGLPKLSYVDANNLIYYAGAGAYQLRHGVSLDEARAMIAKQFGLISVFEVQNAQVTHLTPVEIDAQLRAAQWKVLARYPAHLAASSVLGVIKASVSHATRELAEMCGRTWIAPGRERFLAAPTEALARLGDNGPALTLAFVWQMAHTLGVLLLAAVGAVLLLRDPRSRPAGLILLAMLAYVYLTTALFGLEAYWRCRMPAMPMLYLFAGCSIATLRSGKLP